MPRVRKVTPPPESCLAALYSQADYVDAYAVALPPSATSDAGALAERAFAGPGLCLGGAMVVRDAVMRRFRVKTSAQIAARLDATRADRINGFPVLSRSGGEIVLGEDDRHLDFRLSFQLRRNGRTAELVATTVVHCHNRLGRTYLASILPGHWMVMRSAMRKAAAPR